MSPVKLRLIAPNTWYLAEYLDSPDLEQLMCPCGNKALSIFQANYATIAKCDACDFSAVIHEG